MAYSAARCGIKEGTFAATADGVLAAHDTPLPPIPPQFFVSVVVGDGYAYREVGIKATDAKEGTLFTFEIPFRPEGDAQIARFKFEGDPGVDYVLDPNSPGSSPPPVMSVRQAIVTNQVSRFLTIADGTLLRSPKRENP